MVICVCSVIYNVSGPTTLPYIISTCWDGGLAGSGTLSAIQVHGRIAEFLIMAVLAGRSPARGGERMATYLVWEPQRKRKKNRL